MFRSILLAKVDDCSKICEIISERQSGSFQSIFTLTVHSIDFTGHFFRVKVDDCSKICEIISQWQSGSFQNIFTLTFHSIGFTGHFFRVKVDDCSKICEIISQRQSGSFQNIFTLTVHTDSHHSLSHYTRLSAAPLYPVMKAVNKNLFISLSRCDLSLRCYFGRTVLLYLASIDMIRRFRKTAKSGY